MSESNMHLSKRTTQIEGSRTARLIPAMARLRQAGRDVINFAVGEPDTATPMEVIEATHQALSRGETRYGPTAGLPALREAIARRFGTLSAGNILVTNGSKQGLYLIFQAICDPGDRVILPAPCWVSFPEQIKLAGAVPVFVPCRGHRLDVEAITGAISPRTRAVLINSPNNPTGAVYGREDLGAVVKLCMEKDLYLISDEAYDAFVYDGLAHVSPLEWPEARDRVIVTRSFSKPFPMTGFRVGYVAAPTDTVAMMERLQSHVTGNVCTFAQHGALAALAMEKEYLPGIQKDMARRRDLAHALATERFDCIRPQGAFYLFPDISTHLKNGETAEDFSLRLLEKTGVATVPGEAFGAVGHLRISYAVAEDLIEKGFERIRKFCLP
jgi:aspartate aminotransferase